MTSTARMKENASQAGRGGHVLIVDDNTLNQMVLRRALLEHGHTVSTAEHGKAGLDLLRAQHPLIDVVLPDIMMPVMDGFQTLAEIMGDSALRDLAVIMISSVEESDAVIGCLRMGARDYIPKPFNVTSLSALGNRINALLAAKWSRQREAEHAYIMEELTQLITNMDPGEPAPARLFEIGARRDSVGRLARAVERLSHRLNTQAPQTTGRPA
jgi:CheY-like chemotaxis protein